MNGAANTSAFLPRERTFTIDITGIGEPVAYVYLILRDLSRNGETAGAVMIHINRDGSLRDTPAHIMRIM
jgi:hypothetical protein